MIQNVVLFKRLTNLKVLKSTSMQILLVAGVLQAQRMQNVLSRTGFVICHAKCPIVESSKLQTKITLSTAEAEYAMSHALCETIRIQNLMKVIHCIISMPNPMTDFCTTVHEDNLLAVAMAKPLKFTPCTKHIAIKYHHFCSRVNTSSNPSGDIKIKYIFTKKQLADILTKPIDAGCLFLLCNVLCGWQSHINSSLFLKECENAS